MEPAWQLGLVCRMPRFSVRELDRPMGHLRLTQQLARRSSFNTDANGWRPFVTVRWYHLWLSVLCIVT